MKTLLASILMIGFAAYADVYDGVATKIVAKDVTCEYLQEQVESKGVVYIVNSPLGGQYHYSNGVACDFNEEPNVSYNRTQTGWCKSGYVCEQTPSGE